MVVVATEKVEIRTMKTMATNAVKIAMAMTCSIAKNNCVGRAKHIVVMYR